MMRNGYKTHFLGVNNSNFHIKLPEPGLALQEDILKPQGFPEGVIPYINYSLLMSKSTKQALYSAANINNSLMKN